MNPDDDAKQAWQTSVEIAGVPPLEEVRAGADKFYRFVRRRNMIEYAAGVVAAVVFTIYIFTLPHPLQKLGSGMIVLGIAYAVWQLHRRASAVAPETAGTMPILAFSRMQLARQRDALRSIFWWYILPFLPGLAVLLIGNGQNPELAAKMPMWARWVALGGMTAIFAGIWWMNQVVARKLQRRIDEIDALTGERE